MKSLYKLVAGLVFAGTISLSFHSCTTSTAKTENEKETTAELSASMKKIVATEKVTSSTLSNKIRLTGTVEALPNKQIRIPAIVSGRVTNVMVAIGDEVKKGQVLAKIYSADMAEVKQEWIEAKANVDREEKEFEVANSLFDAGLSSALELQQAKSELEAAKAQLEKVNQTLQLMGESNNATHIVRAPMSGTVIEKNITANMLLRDDFEDAMFTIVNLSDVWVKINVFESDLSKVQLGAKVEAKAMAYPNETFTGKIEKMSKMIDPETKVLSARVAMSNEDKKLLPNMAMNVVVYQNFDEEVLEVPDNAIVFHNNKDYVVKKVGQEFKVVPVTVKGNNDNKVFISGDLKSNDHVVSEKALLLFNELMEQQLAKN
ncbi:efflux RND transporter periplasmic adaptor subunit [Flammeovirga sp. EKP202]|uniref:efflux RND transporter periplasmic adaptor subunit n=1 Tax=Flammeovirga sp. EKP202 TaxID=2770592 RepID=UPI00165ED36D|nr:efflux RND transporter periplasmic adaptor subunit [Flammeovirga sp. EKP202]MBD0404839.1 efflux RND transporter periplasmic adaptor subunit [Flammeovirga sp. EKP202]